MVTLRVISILILFSSSFHTWSQETRGQLITNNTPTVIESFYTDSLINLKTLRQYTNFLTNRDILTDNNTLIPKRKKAFTRHVKHLSEELELQYQRGLKRTKKSDEKVYELFLLSESLKHKAFLNSYSKVTFGEKVSMMKHTIKSKRVLKIEIPQDVDEKINDSIQSPATSPYYHPVQEKEQMHKQFAELAKQKKIDVKKNMVVLFKEVSQSGSSPKIRTVDLDLDNEWNIKWGDEVHTDIVGSRIFAALGYDVDHPYFFEKDKLTLVFDDFSGINSANSLREQIKEVFDVDIVSFILSSGSITEELAKETKALRPFVGQNYVQFYKCSLEARADRVKRLGSFLPDTEITFERKELRGALLAHLFIGNWDTREANTLLTTVHDGNYNYRISAVFSDLGTSMGVKLKFISQDFKVGLVNEFSWEVLNQEDNTIKVNHRINSILDAYKYADYNDWHWMANQIADIDEYNLRMMVKKAHWPAPIEELYIHKLASRRASILKAFNITDPHPIPFDKNLTILQEGKELVKNGVLMVDYKRAENLVRVRQFPFCFHLLFSFHF